MTNDIVLQVADLHVTFGAKVRAVRGLGYELARGEVLGIVGESGSGKSASAQAIMGLLPRSAEVRGSVKLNGRELIGLDDAALSGVRGNSIAMVFQDPLSALTPVYTIGDQIAEAVRVHNDVSKEAAHARAAELLELVGIPRAKERARAFPHEFSGGMRQRVMIAMAIANHPDVIVADEPTTALDVTIQAQVLEVLRTAREVTGAAIVMITHDLGVIAGFADRVAVMYAGRIVESGRVDDVYQRPRMPYTMGLLGSIPRLDSAGNRALVPISGAPPSLAGLPPGCPFAPRCPLVFDRCRDEEPALAPVGGRPQLAACHRAEEIERGGFDPADVFPVPDLLEPVAAGIARADRPIVLLTEDLIKHHPLLKGAVFKRQVGTVRAVDGISFDIREGETLGLVGESGCGKTTTLLQVLELVAPQAGRIVVLGQDVAQLDARKRRAVRRDLQVVFQDPLASLDPRMPISDILAEPLRTNDVSRERTDGRIRELLELVGLEPSHAERYPAEFSGGQRQRIAIARALALEPKLLVLDEPVSALDVSIRAGVINLLAELRARLGLSYLFVAHDLSVVRHIADRVAVMYLGRIAEIGAVAPVYDTPAHPYTQALLSAIPIPDPVKERARVRILLVGDQPSPSDKPSGCRFRTRCPKFIALDEGRRRRCVEEEPELESAGGDQAAACHYAEKIEVV
ncbi:MAG: glutathione transport system ATP-binding protein [Solirubrobacteraceae bacterium]|nr:glutathione transport system ATP-binding protein [Solirubrobacteraceae bacterium]